jgi:hypothetical protein
VTPNYALERTVRGWSERAAGMRRNVTRAARWLCCTAAAQRGR